MSMKGTFATTIIVLFHVTQSQLIDMYTSVPANCSLCTYFYTPRGLYEIDPLTGRGCPLGTGVPQCCTWRDYDYNIDGGDCVIFNTTADIIPLHWCGGCDPTANYSSMLVHVIQNTSVCASCTYYYADAGPEMSDSDLNGYYTHLLEYEWGPSYGCDSGRCCEWLDDYSVCAINDSYANNTYRLCGGCPQTTAPSRAPSAGPTHSTCGYSTFKYRNTSACFECDVDDIGYECQGGSTLNVEYGYWVGAQTQNGYNTLQMINTSYSDNPVISLRCPVGQCCATHSRCDYLESLKSRHLCAKNRNISSVACSRCNNGYNELLGSATCGDQCKQTDYILVSLLFVMALIFALVLLFILSRPTHLLSNLTDDRKEINWRKLVVYDRKSLVIVLLFKIYLYYYQGLSQILFAKNITPTSQFAKMVLTLFAFDVSLVSMSSDTGFCLIGGIQSGVYELLISYIGYAFIAINVMIIAFTWKCMYRRRNTSWQPYIKSGCIYMILMTAGPLLSTSFKFLTCIKVRDRPYHFYDAEIPCYGYIWFFAGLLPIVLLCGVLLRLWFVIYKQDASQKTNETNPYRSVTKRFKSNMWHWEFVLFIRRFGIAALTSFYDLADQMTSIILVAFIVLLFALQTKFHPFKHQRANMLESICLFGTISVVIALIVMKEATVAMSWYLTLLIIAPLVIVCVIIADIVYKWCKYDELSVDTESDLYKKIKKRWFENEDVSRSHCNTNVTSHVNATHTIKQQIEHAETEQQLMPILEMLNFSDLKKKMLQYCDENPDVNERAERINTAKTMTFNGEDTGAVVSKMHQDMVYCKEGNRFDDHESMSQFSVPSDLKEAASADSKEENDELVYNEVELVNADHVVVALYHQLNEYLKYNSDENGKGIMVQTMKRNEYGTALYAQYGFNESDGWFVECIDGNKVTNKGKGDIDGILNRVDVNQGYEVVFKKRMKSVKNVSKKLKQIKKSKDWADRSQHLLDDEQSVQRGNATLTEDPNRSHESRSSEAMHISKDKSIPL
eukprot:289403_1